MMSAGRETAAEKQATVTPAKSVTVAEKVGEVKTEAGTVKTITVDCSGADPEPEYHMDMIGVLSAESIDVNAPTVPRWAAVVHPTKLVPLPPAGS